MSMLKDPSVKYRAFPQINLPDRQWPSKTITRAPRWLSTDLRDGNQSLIDPMGAEKKTRFFDLLVKVGLKEIEVGFPSAGATEFDFISGLVREGRVPEDVLIQVLTQSREDLITTSFESLEGVHAAIVHLYNAVSPLWRTVVFGLEKPEIKAIAVAGAKVLREGTKATIVSAGVTLFEALKAADTLKAEGVTVTVIDAYSVKPLGKDVILAAAKKTGNVVITVEDHYPEGGLGDAIAGELSSEGVKVHKLAVNGLPRSGHAAELMAAFGIDAAAIVKKVKSL